MNEGSSDLFFYNLSKIDLKKLFTELFVASLGNSIIKRTILFPAETRREQKNAPTNCRGVKSIYAQLVVLWVITTKLSTGRAGSYYFHFSQ